MKPDLKGLTKLARVLRGVPKKQFDMGDWYQETPCGTKGCIAGWAAMVFPYRFKKDYPYTHDDGNITSYDVIHRASGEGGEVGFAKAFRISEEDAEDLTLGNMSKKRTPKAAAKAVMALVGRLKKSLKK